MSKPIDKAEKVAGASGRMLPWIVALVLMCFGFLLGYSWGASKVSAAYNAGQENGWEAARATLDESGWLEPYDEIAE